MAISFPTNPTINQTYTYLTVTYVYDGKRWSPTATINSLTPNVVTTGAVLDSAITSSKLADNSVTSAKIADNSVTSAKIADGSVSSTDMTASGIANNQTLTSSGNTVVWTNTIHPFMFTQ